MQQGKSNIIWYIVGGIVLIGGGVGTYFFLKKRKEKKESEERALKEQEADAAEAAKPTSSTTSSSSVPNTPFKNNTEGNAFREWVNKNYPDYAKEIDLSMNVSSSNGYNNTTIRKAYAKYGSEYSKGTQTPTTTQVTGADGFSKVKSQMLDTNIWGNNIKLDTSTQIKFIYALDVAGLKDAYIAFNKNGEFSVSFMFGSITKGNWSYSNDSFSLTLSDGSYLGQGSNIAKLVKELLKAKYPDKMQYFKFEGVNSVNSMLNMSGKAYADAQDSIL
jgi:hypothetical protein